MKPLAFLLAGQLADCVFEPLLTPDEAFADSIGQMIGIGAGRGIGLLFFVMGIIKIAVALSAYSSSHIRRVEEELPDTAICQTQLEAI